MKRRASPRPSEAVVFGIHSVTHFLDRCPARVRELMVAEDRRDRRLENLTALATQRGLEATRVPRQALDRRAGGGTHQGVVAIVEPRAPGNENDLAVILDELSRPCFLLVLDGVQDPHNLGACLRTADAVGVDAVIAPRNRAAGLTATVRKVACGASETVPFIQVTNLARVLRQLGERGVCRVGAAEDASVSLFDADLAGSIAIIMGAEGRGLRRLTREHCDLLVSMPMRGAVESLNVSVATGICLYAALAQRTGSGQR